MKAKNTTAGKTATKKTKNTSAKAKAKYMRLVHHRDGRTTLRTPDGRELVGTRAELAAAGLSPHSRDILAKTMQLRRGIAKACSWSADERCRDLAATRLEAIESEQIRRSLGEPHYIPLDTFVMIHASARFMGQTVDEFIQESLRSAIDGTIDLAIHEGNGELPLSRQERAAFKGKQSDYSSELAYVEAKAAAM